MRLGQGSRKKTSIWAWVIFVGAVALVLLDAAFVDAQGVADFSKPRAEPTETPKSSPATEPPAAAIESARSPRPPADGANPDTGSHNHERYERVSLLGEVTSGGPATALGPPTDAEVMQARKSVRHQKNSPGFGGSHRKIVRIVKEKTADYAGPLRSFPLIGTAQLHHAHYKCTIYFTERTTNDSPCEAEGQDAVEVLYIDHNHFHMPSDPEADGSDWRAGRWTRIRFAARPTVIAGRERAKKEVRE